MTNIDIVVPFVDNTREKWQKDFLLWKSKECQHSNDEIGDVRFRNWDDFKYFIRSVCKHCNWFRKLVIIVQDEDQIPDWLDTSNERLKIVYHKDYIPNELLHTFNSNVIECFIPLIDDVSDTYVLCNDDTFFFDDVDEDFFSKDNLPVLEDFKVNYELYDGNDLFTKTLNNNLRFEKRLFPQLQFRWSSPHFQVAHNKLNDYEVLTNNLDYFISSFKDSKFRNNKNLTHHIYNDISRIDGKCILDTNIYRNNSMFFPLNVRSKFNLIPKIKMCCINDAFIGSVDAFEKTKKDYLNYLNLKFPERSEFEKW